MKIARLNLVSFGHFRDFTLEFPENGPGLHLIVGPNEAGKTTTLHALKCLLFGFDFAKGSEFPDENYKNDYEFIPDAPKPKLGATLINTAGEHLNLVRHKGKPKARQILADDGKTEIDGTKLARFLPPQIDPRTQSLFLATHAELVQGSKEIIAGGGDFATILFTGAGLPQITRVLQRLKEKADGLFKPQAQNPPINALLSELDKTKKLARDLALSGDKWREESTRLEQAEADATTLHDQVERDTAERHRLDRLRTIQPLLSNRAEAIRKRAALGNVKLLRPDLGDELRDLQRQSAEITDELTTQSSTLQELETKITTDHDALLSQEKTIDDLRQQLSAYRAATLDFTAKQDQYKALERSLDRDLERHSPGLPLDEIPTLKVDAARLDAIKKLQREVGKLDEACRLADTELARLTTDNETQQSSANDPQIRDILDELAAFIAKVREHGDLDDHLQKATSRFEKSKAKHARSLESLPLWNRSIAELITAKIPADATITRFKSTWDNLATRRQEFEKELRAIEKERKTIEKNIAEDSLHGEVPSEADLDAIRQSRNATWTTIKRSLIEGKPPETPARLAQEFDDLLMRADAISDAIKREAKRVHQRAQWQLDLRDLADRQAESEENLEKLDKETDQANQDWRTAWQPCEIDPLPPAEMADWIRERKSLITSWEPVEKEQGTVHELREEIDAIVANLRTLFNRLSAHTPANDTHLASWLASAERLITQGTHGESVAVAQHAVKRATDARNDWQKRWDDAIAALGLSARSSFESVDERLKAIDALIENGNALSRLCDELQILTTKRDAFEMSVRDLATALDANADNRESGELITALTGRVQSARTLENRRIQYRESLDRARATQRRLTHQLEALCQEATCLTLEELKQAIPLSSEARELDSEIEAEEKRIRQQSLGRSLEEIEQEALAEDFDSLPARLESLEEKIAGARPRSTELGEKIGAAKLNLEAMRNGAGAAGSLQDMQQIIGDLEDNVAEYARFRLAEAVLRKAVDRYREQNQGPILGRTNDLFKSLTLGSFEGIVSSDEVAEPTKKRDVLEIPKLLGIRANELSEKVPVNVMSRGTADALYLAIRLATLEHHLESHEAMPFVVDDILVQFDDRRSTAALRALAELSARTQVLFFTHHHHLADLATSALGKAAVHVHELPARLMS